MLRMNGFVVALLLYALTMSGCANRQAPANDEAMNARMNALADRYVDAYLERAPEAAYYTGLPAPTHAKLRDNSLAALAQWEATEDELYRALQAIDASQLGAREWLAWGGMKELLEASRGLRVCRGDVWQTVNHMFGWHLNLSFFAGRQPVSTPEERADALQRWGGLPSYVDTEIVNLTQGLEQGYSAARPVAQAMLKQIDQMLASPAESWPLYAMAERAKDDAFEQKLKTLIDTDIRAAVTRYRDFLRDTYIPAAREELAVTTLPEGDACYRAMLRDYTTLDRDPGEVFALGETTVKRNLAYVLTLSDELFGLRELDAIVEHVNDAPDNRFESEEQLVAHSRATVQAAREKVARLFLSLPEAPVVVEPFPEYQRGSGRSSHYQPPGSAGEPGEYRISLDFWQTETIGGAEITAVHEAWPGHHLQIAKALALEDQHPIMKLAGSSGYVEGWARYSEHLAEEAGIYTVPYARITRRLWPARGMVADPGIHVYGWTAEQATQFLEESGRFSAEESVALITRIAAIPGQLTAYDSGALVIFELRREAEQALGDQFDIREFHERVLENGALPLWQLQNHVRAWIAQAQTET